MMYDGKLLALARAGLEKDREANRSEQQRRIDLAYHQIPELEQIDLTLRSHMAELVRLTLSKPTDLQDRIHELQERNLDLQMRRAELLTQNGYAVDWLDEIYSCPICRDTGYVGTEICDCLRRRCNLEMTRELSGLLKSGQESFDNFDLNYYPDTPDPKRAASPGKQWPSYWPAAGNLQIAFRMFPPIFFSAAAPDSERPTFPPVLPVLLQRRAIRYATIPPPSRWRPLNGRNSPEPRRRLKPLRSE